MGLEGEDRSVLSPSHDNLLMTLALPTPHCTFSFSLSPLCLSSLLPLLHLPAWPPLLLAALPHSPFSPPPASHSLSSSPLTSLLSLPFSPHPHPHILTWVQLTLFLLHSCLPVSFSALSAAWRQLACAGCAPHPVWGQVLQQAWAGRHTQALTVTVSGGGGNASLCIWICSRLIHLISVLSSENAHASVSIYYHH